MLIYIDFSSRYVKIQKGNEEEKGEVTELDSTSLGLYINEMALIRHDFFQTINFHLFVYIKITLKARILVVLSPGTDL